MKHINIGAQNFFEERANNALDLIEKEINIAIDTYNNGQRTYNEDEVLEGIIRLYNTYTLIQADFWDRN